MSKPQSAIVPEPSAQALFLQLRVRNHAGDAAAVAAVAAEVPALTREVAALDEKSRLCSAIAFGANFWDAVSPERRPAGLRAFHTFEGPRLRAPASGGDLLLHAVARHRDLPFELASRLRRLLGDRVEVMDEVSGFRYLDTRDLTGFIDGTENPKGSKLRSEVALVGREDRDFAGGSYVLTQRYIHDLEAWSKLPTEEQERVIGRRKRDSKELSAKRKPADAHISRAVVVEDGEELEIVRHSYPYGTTSESGLFFIAYSRTLDTFDKILARLMGTSGDSLHDRLMEFTHPISGAYWFAPSLKTLKRFR